MNQQERDEVRKKHTLEPYEDRITGQEVTTCAHCCTDEWPCDVIKVLDALEEVTPTDATSSEVHHDSEVSATREVCDHWVGVRGSGHYRYGSTTPPAYWTHTYCPKCGEKL